MGDLSKHFSKDEMKCKCCGLFIEHKPLIRKLEKLRGLVGIPLYISSGVRCMHNNTMAGGVDGSAHLTGKAADIFCRDMFLLRKYAYQVFDRIGLAKNYVHVDVDEDKKQLTDWFYG